MNKLYIAGAIALASVAFVSAEDVAQQPRGVMSTRGSMTEGGIRDGKAISGTRASSTQIRPEAGRMGEGMFPTTGDKALDAKIKALVEERNAKMKAIQDEFQIKLKALIGDKKLRTEGMMASGTRPMMGSSTWEGRGEGRPMMASSSARMMRASDQEEGDNRPPRTGQVRGEMKGPSDVGAQEGSFFKNMFQGMFGGR